MNLSGSCLPANLPHLPNLHLKVPRFGMTSSLLYCCIPWSAQEKFNQTPPRPVSFHSMARCDGAGRHIAIALLAATATRCLASAAIHNIRADLPIQVGCFATPEPLDNQGSYKYQSSGYCSGICTSLNQGVVGLSDGNVCWCGDELPPLESKVLDSKCNTPCQGYGLETCTSVLVTSFQ